MSSNSKDMQKSESTASTSVDAGNTTNKMEGDAKKTKNMGTSKETLQPKHRSCIKVDTIKNRRDYERNPITGDGLSGDGVGGIRPITRKIRDGNPLTGEGYKPGKQDYIGPINMSDAHETINLNTTTDGRTHIPPGGYSSGLW